jgi:hypothetical protein
LSIRAELVEESKGLSFEILVGGRVPSYLDGIFDLVGEIYEQKVIMGRRCSGVDTSRPHHGEVHEIAVSTYLRVHDGSRSCMSARLSVKGLQISVLAAMRIVAVELGHISCFPRPAIETWFF